VPFISDPGGTPGTDYDVFLPQGTPEAAAAWSDWLKNVLKGKGNTIFVGGIPANPSSQGAMSGLKKGLDAAGGGIKLLNAQPIDTNWDPAEEQRVMAGVLTQYQTIDAVVSDYGVASVGGIRAFKNAGRPIPALATFASSNELGCVWKELKPTNPNFQVLSYDGTTRVVRGAVRKALAKVNKVDDKDPAVYQLIKFMDTTAGMDPPCDPALPPDADLSSSLSKEALAKLFK
jgi:ribose transport system substrate-binding protein